LVLRRGRRSLFFSQPFPPSETEKALLKRVPGPLVGPPALPHIVFRRLLGTRREGFVASLKKEPREGTPHPASPTSGVRWSDLIGPEIGPTSSTFSPQRRLENTNSAPSSGPLCGTTFPDSRDPQIGLPGGEGKVGSKRRAAAAPSKRPLSEMTRMLLLLRGIRVTKDEHEARPYDTSWLRCARPFIRTCVRGTPSTILGICKSDSPWEKVAMAP
jgi:hypothetical protein